jgi:uncharacterized membrane protein YgdD (TMEM256/DUF423 family)
MSQTSALRIAAVLGFLAVALGAFGAHSLKELLARQNTAAIWEKAVLYHAIHAVMMFVIASRAQFSPFSWWCFFIGVLLFSGSLYLLAVTNTRWLGAITPLGGIGFLAGWLCLALSAGRLK